MNISGSTNTCVLTANVPFYQSGSTDSSSSSSVITITDENGIDLTNCFGVLTSIGTVTSTGVSTDTSTNGGTTFQSGGTSTTPIDFETDTTSLTGACQNILIINPVLTGDTETECLYTGTTQLNTGSEVNDGLILLTYSGGSTSLNVHPDCCTNINETYTSEIGSEHYFVCRYREWYDSMDCKNYTISGDPILDPDDFVIFDKTSGGTTTIVPSAECCYDYEGLKEFTELPDGIRCVINEPPVCAEYELVNAPDIGDAEFKVVATGNSTYVVPTAACCSTNGLSSKQLEPGKFVCYTDERTKPTVSVELQTLCCEPVIVPCISTQTYKKYYGFQKLRYTHPLYTEPKFNPDSIQCGTKVKIWIRLWHYKNGKYDVNYNQTFTATKDYDSVREWFYAEVVNLGVFGDPDDGWLRGWGFSTDGSQFWVHSRKDGTQRSDNRTEVYFEIGLP